MFGAAIDMWRSEHFATQIISNPEFARRTALLKSNGAQPYGIQLARDGKRVVISSVTPASIAALSDLVLPGDIVTHVNRSTNFTFEELSNMLATSGQIILSFARPEVRTLCFTFQHSLHVEHTGAADSR